VSEFVDEQSHVGQELDYALGSQSSAFFALMNDLAEDADDARRGR
jgi:hypothetical protein